MLGLCCQFLQNRTKRSGEIVSENAIDEKSLQLGAYKNGKYSEERIIETYRNNVEEHIKIFPRLLQSKIKSFRLSSSLFPLFEFCGDYAKSDKQLIQKLATLGKMFKDNNIRVTTHPGQFTILSSDKQSVIDNSIKELEYHAWVFDQMGFDKTPYYAINIHGGKANRSEVLINSIQSLPENVRNRLTLENDERCYNVTTLLRVCRATNTPLVLDTHHWSFGVGDMGLDKATEASIETWDKIKPLQHLSNTEKGMESAAFNQRRAHSQYIHYIPEIQLKLIRDDLVDVDVEAKSKNFAIDKMRKDFNIEV